jgi:hypothetical protein
MTSRWKFLALCALGLTLASCEPANDSEDETPTHLMKEHWRNSNLFGVEFTLKSRPDVVCVITYYRRGYADHKLSCVKVDSKP